MTLSPVTPTTAVASRPYPWPWHGVIRPERAALLVFSGDGPSEIDTAALDRLGMIVEAARGHSIPVVALPYSGPRAVPPVEVTDVDAVVPRPHFGAFHGSDIAATLRRLGVTDLLIAGFPFELGADCTMREANDLGYECLLLEDCCSAVSPETFAGAVKSLEYSGGIFGAAATSVNVLRALRDEIHHEDTKNTKDGGG